MGSNKRISLERLQPKFEMLIRNWVEDRKDQGMNFGILADMVGVHPTHLSNLICRKKKDDPNSAYRRPLTAFYVEPFLDRGVFTMDQGRIMAFCKYTNSNYKLSIDYGFEITNSNRISTSSLRSGVMPCLGAHFFATNLFIEDSFPPGTRPVLGAARQFFSPFSNPPSGGVPIGGAPRFMGVR